MDQEHGGTDWLRTGAGIAIVALVTHPLLDGFTPYGTQFFAPFVRETGTPKAQRVRP